MIQLLHGDDIVATDKLLATIKARHQGEILNLDSARLTQDIFLQSVQSGSFLDPKPRLVIIDNPDLKKSQWLLTTDPNSEINLVIVFNKKLTPSQTSTVTKSHPQIKVYESRTDPVIFKFLEALNPGRQQDFLPIWQKYIATEEPEIALTMIVRQFRFLLLAKSETGTGPDEYQDLKPWLKARLSSQARLFTLEKLKTAYSGLEDVDFRNKTGALEGSLPAALEFFLLQL